MSLPWPMWVSWSSIFLGAHLSTSVHSRHGDPPYLPCAALVASPSSCLGNPEHSLWSLPRPLQEWLPQLLRVLLTSCLFDMALLTPLNTPVCVIYPLSLFLQNDSYPWHTHISMIHTHIPMIHTHVSINASCLPLATGVLCFQPAE